MEEFLLKIGGFGRYQGFLMFFVFVTSFTCGSNYYSQVFSLLEPPKTCISDGLNTQGECLILSANNDTLECSNWSYNYSDQFPTLVSEIGEEENNIYKSFNLLNWNNYDLISHTSIYIPTFSTTFSWSLSSHYFTFAIFISH
ncbi:SLC22A23 [Lepeophtheirus salmonis]|uniref:SLC22A23 n=1 Tax=Lepeophtheirus salmonis TaxID=72036 RepID=A0A7R8CEB5_LEPSM|nr:SLC22A23 [Lepeophtheirus salmonis]CAF2793693.1 SLC22A23 [Lepeophtheirus salmonis]